MPPLPQQDANQIPQQAPSQPGPVSTPGPSTPQAGAQAQTTPQVADWQQALPAIAQRHGVDPELLKRLVQAESGGDPNASDYKTGTHKGLGQLSPELVKQYGIDPKDPLQNLGVSASELGRLLKKYNNNYGRAIAAYNAGEGVIDGLPMGQLPQNGETPAYVLRVLEGYQPPQQAAQPKPEKASPAWPPAIQPYLFGTPQQYGDTGFGTTVGNMIPQWMSGPLAAMSHGGKFATYNVPGIEQGEEALGKAGQAGSQALQADVNALIHPLQTFGPKSAEQRQALVKQGGDVPAAVSQIQREHPNVAAIAASTGQNITQLFADPRNWPFMGKAALAPVWQKLVSSGFGAQMTYGALQHAANLWEKWDSISVPERTKGLADLGFDVSGATLGIHGAVEEAQAPGISRPVGREQVQPSGAVPATEPPQTQVAPQQAPSVGQEGGPQQVTQAGQTGAQEITGRTQGLQVPAQASAPIEGAGVSAGKGAPATGEMQPHTPPTTIQQKIGQARQAGLLPDLRQQPGTSPTGVERRTQAERDYQQAVSTTPPGTPTPGEQLSQDIRQARAGAPSDITEGHAMQRIMRDPALYQQFQKADNKARNQMLVQAKNAILEERQSAQRPTGGAEAPTPTTAQPTGQSLPSARPAEAPTRPAGEPLRPSTEPVRQPVQQVTKPAYKPYVPLPASERPRVPAGGAIPTKPEAAPPGATPPSAPVEVPTPTPRPKKAMAPEVEAWKETRRTEAQERQEAMRQNAQVPGSRPEQEPWHSLGRTVDRVLKTPKSEARDAELRQAVDRVKAQGPEAIKAEGEKMRVKAQRAQAMQEWGQMQLDPERREFIKDTRGEGGKKQGTERIPGKLGQGEVPLLPDAYAEWAQKKGLDFDPRSKKEKGKLWTGTIPGHTREALNRALGNQMKEVGERKALPEADEKEVANLERKRDELVNEIRRRPRPTERQLSELETLIVNINARRGIAHVAEKGPQPRIGENGELLHEGGVANREAWNRFMDRPVGSHSTRPTDEEIQTRLENLKREGALARSVAKQLGIEIPEPVKATPPAAEEPAKADTLQHAGGGAEPAFPPPAAPVSAEERATTTPNYVMSEDAALSGIANLPREAREAFQGLNASEQKEFVERYRQGQHPELDVLAPEERLAKAPEPAKAESKAPEAPRVKPEEELEALKKGLAELEAKKAPEAEKPLKGAGVPSPKMQEAIRRELSKPHVERPTEEAPIRPSGPVSKTSINRERLEKLGDRIQNLPKEQREDLGKRLNDVSTKFEELSEKIKLAGRTAREMREAGETKRTYTRKSDGKQVTETLEQVETRAMLLGQERQRLVDEHFPSMETAVRAFERSTGEAPAPIAPSRAEKTLAPVTRYEYNPSTKKYEPVSVKAEEVEKPSQQAPARAQQEDQLKQMQQHLANLEDKLSRKHGFDSTEVTKGTKDLREQIRAVESQLGINAPAAPPGVKEQIEGTALERAAKPPRPKTETKTHITKFAPIDDPAGELAEKLTKENLEPGPIHDQIEKNQRPGALKGREMIARAIMDQINEDKLDPIDAQKRYQQALKHYVEGLKEEQKNPELPKKALTRAIEYARTGEIIKGGRTKEAGFAGGGRFQMPKRPLEGLQEMITGRPKGGWGMEAAKRIKAEQESPPGKAAWIDPERGVSTGVSLPGDVSGHSAKASQILGRETLDLTGRPTDELLNKGWIRKADVGNYEVSKLSSKIIDAIEKDYIRDGSPKGLIIERPPAEGGDILLSKDAVIEKGLERAIQQYKYINRTRSGEAGFVSPFGRGRIDQRVQKAHEASKDEETFKARMSEVKNIGQAFVDWFKHPERGQRLSEALRGQKPQEAFKQALGGYSQARQQAKYALSNMTKAIKSEVPAPEIREALTNYIQAGGDKELLEQRAQDHTNKKLAVGYENAAKLTPNEVLVAKAIQSRFDDLLQEGRRMGVLEHGLENYITQIWDRDNPAARGLLADVQAGKFQTNFKYARQRMLDSYFEGEMLGKTPKNKDAAFLLATYENSMQEAIAARKFVKDMFGGTAPDGRPLIVPEARYAKPFRGLEGDVKGYTIPLHGRGQGHLIDRDLAEQLGIPVNEKTLTENEQVRTQTGDYKAIQHPAFRKWTFSMRGPDGKPVLVQADARVHPDIAQHLENIYTQSWFRRYAPTRWFMQGQAVLKNVLLGFPGFHYVQEGLHASFHKINPLHGDLISGKRLQEAMKDETVSDLMKNGLMLYDNDAVKSFGEGLAGLSKAPLIGKHIQAMQEHLFQTYIPGLKATLAKKALARNLTRYADYLESGEVTKQQLTEISAAQANAAFGEMNYDWLGRSKTAQDLFRIFALAPDFLESRARFVGQAVRPYGREQLVALGLRAGVYQWLIARTLNMAFNQGNPMLDKDHIFTVKLGDRDYGMRSLAGDLSHLIKDPTGFMLYRMSPAFRLGAAAFSKYFRGRGLPFSDMVSTGVPIPIQGAVKDLFGKGQGNKSYLNSILESFGIQSQKYISPEERQQMEKREEQRLKNLRGEGDKNPRRRISLPQDRKSVV